MSDKNCQHWGSIERPNGETVCLYCNTVLRAKPAPPSDEPTAPEGEK